MTAPLSTHTWEVREHCIPGFALTQQPELEAGPRASPGGWVAGWLGMWGIVHAKTENHQLRAPRPPNPGMIPGPALLSLFSFFP